MIQGSSENVADEAIQRLGVRAVFFSRAADSASRLLLLRYLAGAESQWRKAMLDGETGRAELLQSEIAGIETKLRG